MSGSRQLAVGTDRDGDDRSGAPGSSPAPERGRSDADQRREVVRSPDDGGPTATELLDLLDDDYVQRIFGALSDGPRPACDLADACDASRATVYRRLNRLEEHALVSAEMRLHGEGHHRKVYRSHFERATVELVDGTVEARLVVSEPVDQPSSPPLLSDD